VTAESERGASGAAALTRPFNGNNNPDHIITVQPLKKSEMQVGFSGSIKQCSHKLRSGPFLSHLTPKTWARMSYVLFPARKNSLSS
jgi:hypothetical protein